MGGGRKKFLPDTVKDTEGQRKDSRNLIQEWLNIDRPQGQKSVYVGNRTSLNSINLSETDYLLGEQTNLFKILKTTNGFIKISSVLLCFQSENKIT